jgi:hypothetical protein
VPLPVWDAKQGGSKNTTVVLELDQSNDLAKVIAGRIDHRLYRRGSDGKFSVAYKAESLGSSSGRKVFRNVPRPESGRSSDSLYAAMEVFNVYPDGPSLSQLINHVDMVVIYPEIPVRFKEPLRATMLNSESTDLVKLIRLTAPEEVIDETTKPKSRKTTASLKVDTGDANVPEITIELPVTLTNKSGSSSGGKPVERARSTLRLKTDRPEISVSIPVVVSQ